MDDNISVISEPQETAVFGEYSLAELDNYDAEYGEVVWPQQMVARPMPVKKLYAPLHHCVPLPENIMTDYKEGLETLVSLEKEIETATETLEKVSKGTVKSGVWAGPSRRAAKEAEDKRLAKEIELLTTKKQELVDKFDKKTKEFETTKQIVDIQKEIEKLLKVSA